MLAQGPGTCYRVRVDAKKIANKHFNEVAGASTRTQCSSGVSKSMRARRRLYNKSARRKVRHFAMREQLALVD